MLSVAANHTEPTRTLAIMLGGHVALLTAQELLDLLHWLYDQHSALTELARQDEVSDTSEADTAFQAKLDGTYTSPALSSRNRLAQLIADALEILTDRISLDIDSDAFYVDGNFFCDNDDIGSDEAESIQIFADAFKRLNGQNL